LSKFIINKSFAVNKIRLVTLFCALVITAVANAQGQNGQKTKEQKKQERKERINKQLKEEEEGALVYSKQNAFGFKFNTDGWGGFYEHGKYKTITKTNIWWIDFGEHKNHKEEKQALTDGSGFQIGNPVVYGKINNFYYLKLGVGQQYLIGGKGNKNGVAVTAIYGGGLAFGYLKPYYLTVLDNSTGQINTIRYSAATDSLYRDFTVITGSAGFTKGWGHGTVAPGLHARAALRFDYGRYNEVLSALEVGVNAEYYTKDMRILLDIPSQHLFLNAYVAITFGGRK
jgi:hypothetical protein